MEGNDHTLAWVILGIYIVVLMGIGWWGYLRSKTLSDYYVGGRTLGLWVVSFSFFATYFSSSGFIGGGGYGFQMGFGWSSTDPFFCILFASLAWIVVGPKLRNYTDKLGSITLPDFLGFRYGSVMPRVVAAAIILFAYIFYMVSIYKAAGEAFRTLLDIPYIVGILITLIPVMIYTAIGGFRAVTMTDLIQGALILFGGVLLFVLLMVEVGGWSAGIEQLKQVQVIGGQSGESLLHLDGFGPPPIMKAGRMVHFLITLSLAIGIVFLSAPHMVVRFYAAKDQRIISRGMILCPILVAVFTLCVYSIGPFAWLVLPKMVPASELANFFKNPDQVIPFLTLKMLPPAVGAVILVAVVSAGMSTINSLLLTLATSLGRDVVQALKPSVSNEKILMITRVSSIALAIIPFLIAINPPAVVVVLVGLSFSVIGSAFLAPLMGGLYWKGGTSAGSTVSMVLSTVSCIIWYIFYYRTTWIYPILPGLIVGVGSYILVSLFTKKPDPKIIAVGFER
ncbi:pantothenate permease [Desulfocarbo indianensis]|nr:pantothenate permease [Desulfocarbo indianensis]